MGCDLGYGYWRLRISLSSCHSRDGEAAHKEEHSMKKFLCYNFLKER